MKRTIADLERENEKLRKINAVLMARVERSTDFQGNAFSLFETAIALEGKVRERTAELEDAMAQLAASNAELGAAKEAADEAERRLRNAIDSISEGFALFDAEDRLVLCNQTYLGIWPTIADRIRPGIKFNEIVRMITADGTMLGSLIAPDRWVSERLARHAIANGAYVQALSDGRWIQINELRTDDGGIVGVYTDITEVKAEDARERTRELEEKTAILQATLDNIRLAVCVYDANRRLIAWNGPLLATIGLPNDGLPLVMTHDSMVATCERLNGPMEPHKPLDWLPPGSSDMVSQRRHNGGRVVEVRRSAMPDGGMVMSFEDITERLRASDALREAYETLERRVEQRTADIRAAEAEAREAKTIAEQANLSKTRFLAAASHDLLQPLNAARLFVSALNERRLAPATRNLARQTESALDSVEELLEALLEISKLDAGAVTPEITDFPLARLMTAMKGEFTPIARAKGLQLTVEPTEIWVRSDGRLLRRILQNLISNAIKYTPSGSVTVHCTREGYNVAIRVSDTGPGIAEQHRGEIFEEFRRLHDGQVGRGMGLGLAIVERASRMLDHRLTVVSEVGKGSVFGVDVPLAPARPGVKDGVAAPPRRGSPLGRSVLVIDNDESILVGMNALLSSWNCSVMTVSGHAQALDSVREAADWPDIILADYHLDDGETGDTAIAALRREIGQQVPALILTADRTTELRKELTAQGLYVLSKPVKPAQLRALLSQLLG
ncbi:MAG: NahK/ErcS family hybrid sensor histidine kinase/response regulator [Sphingobium sp.]|nr:NahK/ErcS family hybrid sensor histidine kinase/response regulator [Sphingobium sp.]